MAPRQFVDQQPAQQVEENFKRSISDASASTRVPDSDADCEEKLKPTSETGIFLPRSSGEAFSKEILKAAAVAVLALLHAFGMPLVPAPCTVALAVIQAISLVDGVFTTPAKASVALPLPSMETVSSAASIVATWGAGGFVLAMLATRIHLIFDAGALGFQAALLAIIGGLLYYCHNCAPTLKARQLGCKGGSSVKHATHSPHDAAFLDHLLDPVPVQMEMQKDNVKERDIYVAGSGALSCAPSCEGDFLGLASGHSSCRA